MIRPKKKTVVSTLQSESSATSEYGEAFLVTIDRWDRSLVQAVLNALGADLSAHQPEHLRYLDRFLHERYRETLKRHPRSYEGTVNALGSYLGEVFVRNLGGRWHWPNPLRSLVLLLSLNHFKGERYLYIVLGSEKVLVFKAAREAIDRTAREFSLYDFYQRWAQTKPALTPQTPHPRR